MPRSINATIDRCVGCHTCEIACAQEHSGGMSLEEIALSGKRPGYRINIESFEGKPIPITCRQCEEPACLYACPTGAIYRLSAGKPVLVDDESCIGCSMCVQACPFGMMSMRPGGKVAIKCDLCMRRLADGLPPACVESCPTDTLEFSAEETQNRKKRLDTAARLVSAQKGANSEVAGDGIAEPESPTGEQVVG